MKNVVLITLVLLASFPGTGRGGDAALQDGDLIFQTSGFSRSIAIQKATRSPYSHMGIVFFRKGKPYVLEAVRTVAYTPLEDWIARGEGGSCVVKRLADRQSRLTPEGLGRLRREADSLLGKPYDASFEWSDERIYCSELVWKIYDRALGVQIGSPQKLSQFDLADPAVRNKMKERYGDRVPMEEPVISPGEMFGSEALVTVMRR